MDKRYVVAILLMIAVALLPSVLWPPPPPPEPVADSVQPPADRPALPGPAEEPELPEPVASPASEMPVVRAVPGAPRVPTEEDTISIVSPLYRYMVGSAGGRLVGAWLRAYQSFAPGDSSTLQLVREDSPLLDLALILGRDTVYFAETRFIASDTALSVREGPAQLSLSGEADGLGVRLTYRFRPDEYRFEVSGEVAGLPPTGGVLAVGLGSGLRSVEADTAGDYRSYAVVTRARSTESLGFGKLRPGQVDTLAGPFEWVATKSKYFVAGVIAVHEGAVPFGGAIAAGGPRSGKVASHAAVVATLPVSQQGTFRYDVYVGPQESRHLRAVSRDFEDINPYGWIFRPIIRPIAAVVVSILIWMHEQLDLAYGWVLILFGLAIRLLLWPLNQKAMESSVRMQAIAPLIKEVQERHKGDSQRTQQEMMKLYREHHVNPLGGCLPMLLPMPILFALFFVFANTIEFRGVPFLWLPDLARPDPIYVIPLAMGLSMFALMKIGQIGVPPNPQSRLMLYFMPAFMTVLFLNFSSGLNLYYAATNIFSLPQQWLIATRRKAVRPATTAR